MPSTDKEKREQAKKLYLDSGGIKKLQTIADEIGAKFETVRKWKSRDKWDDSLPKGSAAKKVQGRPRKVNRPGTYGNKNASGTHKKPASTENYKKNSNALRTGLYASIKYANMTDDEKKLIGIVADDDDPIEMQKCLIAELEVREARMYRRIAELQADKEGLVADIMITEIRVKNGEKTPQKATMQKRSAMAQIIDIEAALSVVQRQKQNALNALHTMERNAEAMRMEKERLEIEQARLELQRKKQDLLDPNGEAEAEKRARTQKQMLSIADLIRAPAAPSRELPD